MDIHDGQATYSNRYMKPLPSDDYLVITVMMTVCVCVSSWVRTERFTLEQQVAQTLSLT